LETRVGAGEGNAEQSEATESADQQQPGTTSPFARPIVLQHLQRVRAELLSTLSRRKDSGPDSLGVALERAAGLIEEIQKDFAGSVLANTQQLEVSLTGIERMLNEALRSAVDPETADANRREVKAQLRPYKSHMEPAAYELTFDNLLLKRLRDQFEIPRLSLFYL
jgi:superfamily I DNA/RNA helicase